MKYLIVQLVSTALIEVKLTIVVYINEDNIRFWVCKRVKQNHSISVQKLIIVNDASKIGNREATSLMRKTMRGW